MAAIYMVVYFSYTYIQYVYYTYCKKNIILYLFFKDSSMCILLNNSLSGIEQLVSAKLFKIIGYFSEFSF